ncbi:DUF262 domain-containing protein [Sulfitobacter sp. S223]|uniref:HNH endonuclease family protein n=1 Tax=Sulfitobacter sp. S223 TaxID=2867023 RepID=UPI0021A38791|nr:DUF262 domain-containing protein [Sulfitobacter sp. S223]UWR27356.1 DUF262 domain-containing protein [Sulfitobacter sp. S223]
MKIVLQEITVRELSEDYTDNTEGGVTGYGGKLDIRPPFQREFVYKDAQRDAVIDTASKGFPLNVMYWAVRENGEFEIIDGQQRTISLCQYVNGDFSVQIGSFEQKRAFHNLQDDEQERLLDYPLTVYLCSGTDTEKLEWFQTINIAGAELSDQELRNAVFHGEWVTDAKKWFSKRNCPAQAIGTKYLTGEAIRQKYLETAIKWHAPDGNIEQYMSDHQKEQSAKELWDYFQAVIEWAEACFPKYRNQMKGVPWGPLYNEYGPTVIDSAKAEDEVKRLLIDDDVSAKSGIYSYIFDGKERHLSIRKFSEKDRTEAYERQGGVCPVCKETFAITEMEADHIDPWHAGGKTNAANCQMLCKEDNRRKSGT